MQALTVNEVKIPEEKAARASVGSWAVRSRRE